MWDNALPQHASLVTLPVYLSAWLSLESLAYKPIPAPAANCTCFAYRGCHAHVCILQDRNIILWNPHTGTRVKTYVGHGYDVRDATVSSDNSKFASCGGDKQASVKCGSMAYPRFCGS